MIKFWYVAFIFLFISKYFLIFPAISLTHLLCRSVLFIYTYFGFFQISFYYFLTYCGQRTYFAWFEYLKICRDLFCTLTYVLSWRMFHVHLREVHILLLLSGVFYKSLLDLTGLYCCSSLLFPCYSLSCCSAHYWKWSIDTSNYYFWIV